MRRPSENILQLAKAKGVKPAEITALLLDRPRHADLIAGVRKAGAAVRLITDGDVAGVIHTAEPEDRHRHLSRHRRRAGRRAGGGGAALHRRPDADAGWCSTPRSSASARARWASRIRSKKYEIEDMVKGDCLFAATGVTTGAMLDGVQFGKDMIETETVVMRSVTGTVRWIRAEHRQLDKFHLD